MNEDMSESVHSLSGAYALDALDERERLAFEAHMPTCRDCRAEVASLREAAGLMADDVVVEPPAVLRDNVLAGIRTIRPLPPERAESEAVGDGARTSAVVPMRRRWIPPATLLAAAAAVIAVLVTIGFAATAPWQDDSARLSAADRVLAAPDAKRVSVEFDDGSTATVVRSRHEGRAVLLTQGLPAPPAGKTYELWLQHATGRMAPAGLMSGRGDHKMLLRGDATSSTAVGITVEPAGGSPQPTTKPIALFELSTSRT